MNDLRFALRSLAKAPGFTAVAVCTLAAAIGACSAIFTAVNSVLLRPLPYPDSDRLMLINESYLPDFPSFPVAPGNLTDWSQQSDAFECMYGVSDSTPNLATRDDPVRVLCARVTGRFFDTLGVHPAVGRGFGPADDIPGKNDVVVLTHAFWRQQFGGRTDILNSTIRLNGRPMTVIGIMPAGFGGAGATPFFAERGASYEMYTPAGFTAAELRDHGPRSLMYAVGRLKRGVAVAEARAQLDAIASRLAKQYPDTNKNWGVCLSPMLEAQTGSMRPVFYTLLAAVAVLLLIACANIANLILVRASARQRETSVRTALGASRVQLLRHFLAENLLLAVTGGLLGLIVAQWGLATLLALAPADLPRAQDIALDPQALAVTAALTLLTGIGFGLVPVWHHSRANLVETLKGTARIVGDGSGRKFFRCGLVVAEIALALMLLVTAGLLIRSFGRLLRASPGFNPDHALMAWVMTPPEKYATAEKQLAFVEAATKRFRALPGVTAVGASRDLPFSGLWGALQIEIEGPPVPVNERPVTIYYPVNADYFRAMGIPLLRGRGFTDQDRTAGVAIVSQTFANRLFPGQDPIGKRINVRGGPQTWSEIVGVVGDIRHRGFDTGIMPQVYEPLVHSFDTSMVSFAIRADGDLAALAAPLRRELKALDADQAFFRLERMDQLVSGSIARQQFAMIVVGVFASIALLLAAVGVYGVTSYTVKLRTAEFSIRVALGAQAGDLRRLVLVRGTRLIIPGLAFGAVGALVTARLSQSLLYQTSAHDPLVFVTITALLAAIALAACLIPARRAARVDPMVALRAE